MREIIGGFGSFRNAFTERAIFVCKKRQCRVEHILLDQFRKKGEQMRKNILAHKMGQSLSVLQFVLLWDSRDVCVNSKNEAKKKEFLEINVKSIDRSSPLGPPLQQFIESLLSKICHVIKFLPTKKC